MSEAAADNLLDDDSSAGDKGGEGSGAPGTGADPKQGDKGAAPAKPSLTVVDDDGADPKATAPADWPEDWRDKFAGNDETAKKRLARFSSPASVFKAMINAEKKLSTTRPLTPLAADATEEQIAEYRVANGIPETHDKYDTDMGEGYVWGEDDKPVIDSFLQHAHKANMTPDVVKTNLKWYQTLQETAAAERATLDQSQRDEGVAELRAEYGQEFKGNLNAIRGWLDSYDPGDDQKSGFFDMIFSARMPDGTKLGNHPGIVKAFVDTALKLNPAAAHIPGNIHNSMAGVEDRLNEIRKMMRTDRKAYDADPKIQKEYRTLIDAREGIKKRG